MTPALVLYREELPAEKTSRNYYLQIITHLQSYKIAFCDVTIWAIFSRKLEDILKIVSILILTLFLSSCLHAKEMVLMT